MRRMITHRAPLLALALAVSACGKESDPIIEPYRPYTFTVDSEEAQGVSSGVILEPFFVRAANGDGVGVQDAEIVWTVSSGGGLFLVSVGEDFELVESYANQTGEEGRAGVRFVATELGTTTVTAYGTRAGTVPMGSVEFTVTAQGTAIMLHPALDWQANWPRGVENVAVELGTSVEWHGLDPCCDDHIRSISVPTGGTSFDRRSWDDSVFVFEPDVAGEWRWEWERTDGDWWWPESMTDTLSLIVR